MRRILELLSVLPFAVLLFLAIAGALVALFGGLAGFENARLLGGTISGIGALGFFALLLSPFGEIVAGLLSAIAPNRLTQSNVNVSAQAQGRAPGKKGSEDDRIA